MIYRKRVTKTGFGFKVLDNFLKIEFGRRVWYFERGIVFHNLLKIVDTEGTKANTAITHCVSPWRKTVNRSRAIDCGL